MAEAYCRWRATPPPMELSPRYPSAMQLAADNEHGAPEMVRWLLALGHGVHAAAPGGKEQSRFRLQPLDACIQRIQYLETGVSDEQDALLRRHLEVLDILLEHGAMSATPEATYELISDALEEQPLLTYRLDMWSGTAVPAELSDSAFLLEFEDDTELHPTGEYRTTLHVAWAYPLSAASFAVVDIPCGLVSGLLFVLSTPFAEMGVSPFTEWLK